MSVSATRYVWTINLIGIAVIAAAIVQLVRSPLDIRWFMLAVLALISGATVLRLPFVAASFSVGDAFSFAALFLYGVEAATLTVALDALAITLRLKAPLSRTLFNVAAPCLAMWCAGMVVFRIARLPLPVEADGLRVAIAATAGSVGIMYALSGWLVAAAVALSGGKAITHVWKEHFASLWVNPVSCAYVGVLTAMGLHRFGLSVLMIIAPIPLILYFALRATVGRLNDHLQHLTELNRLHHSTIEAFATAVDAKDQVTHGHIRRVQQYCLALAAELRADTPEMVRALEAAALLHDVGKIGIPEHILNKPGPLTPDEFQVMKGHVAIGVEILSAVEFPFPVVPIVAHHHENWDGSGYPGGARGTDIPLGARILSIVDCFDALTSDRPYRAALSVDAAFDILRERRGTMYDPKIVDRFIELQPQLAMANEGVPSGRIAAAERARPARGVELSSAGDAIAWPLAKTLQAALPDHLCVVYAVDTKTQSVIARAAAGPGSEKVLTHRVPLGHGVSGWVAVAGSRIHETDAGLDFPDTGEDDPLRTLRCSSVPLPLRPPLVLTVYGPASQLEARTGVMTGVVDTLTRVVEACRQDSKTER